MKQDVAVISLDAYAGQFYAQQVQELFGERITVCSYSVRDGSIEHMPRRYDLYMVTTDAFDSLGDLHEYVPIDGEMMEIHVTLRWDVVRRLQSLPAGKRALFVNLSDKMCREAVTRLNQLGVNQLVFDLYHPGAPEPDMGQYDFVITPQETRYVPAGAKEIIDIGQRVCDSSTMIEAALRLGLEELLESERFEQYQREVATNTYSFDRVFARGLRLESQFEMLMEILDEGIVGVNERGEVFACNRKLEEITGIPCGEALHRPAGAVYPFLPFARCLKEKAPQPARVVSAGGVNINVAVAPVLRGDACIGAFATVQRFNDAENRQNELRSQLLHKGYRAKYTFDNVVGQSPALLRCITILKKMSLTPLPVLLIGETGTGKELFAHAVHNASPRAGGAFVAINCAAMPENLLESELFGYEEGAFTGARKGGKPGLFEFAHGGTLFLDEVEGMSTALQCKLLRVLQEREIMRVGGNRIISVDVRIVAATNEDLERRVEEGSFRRDLYYRLNTLPVLIPPLREREGDLLLLIDPQHWGLLHPLARAGAAPAGPPVAGQHPGAAQCGRVFQLPGTYCGGGGGAAPHLPLPPRRRAPGGAARPGRLPPGGRPLRAGAALRGRPGGPQPGAGGHPRRRPGGGAPLLPAGGAAHPGRAGPGGPGAGEPRPGRHPPHPGRAGPVPPADGGGRSGNGLTNLTVFSFFDQFKRALLHLSAGWSWTARRVSFCYA